MKRSSLFQAMHLLWVDEHNRLAKEIEKVFPEKSDEVIFLELLCALKFFEIFRIFLNFAGV